MKNLLMLFHVTAAKRYENHVMRLRTIQTNHFYGCVGKFNGYSAITSVTVQMSNIEMLRIDLPSPLPYEKMILKFDLPLFKYACR